MRFISLFVFLLDVLKQPLAVPSFPGRVWRARRRRRVGPRRPGARCCADASAGAGPLAVGNGKHSQRVTCLSQTLRQFPKTQASVRVTRKPRRRSAEAPPGSPALATFGDAPPPRLQHRVQFTRRSARAFTTERGTRHSERIRFPEKRRVKF